MKNKVAIGYQKMPAPNEVLRDGECNSSEILFNFEAFALVRAAVNPATSQSRRHHVCDLNKVL